LVETIACSNSLKVSLSDKSVTFSAQFLVKTVPTFQFFMRKDLLVLISVLLTNLSFAQTVTKTWNATSPSSISIDGVGNYGYTLPNVSFVQGDFTQGCLVSDVDVVLNWAKTAGTCSAPTGGNSLHAETSFRLDRSGNNQILALPGTWSGNATTASVTTTFDQAAATIPSGTPISGTFRPNNGNLNTYNGTTPYGNWNLSAGDNGVNNPLCVTYYSVTVSTAPDNTAPTFTSFPTNISLNATPGNCFAPASWTAPTATDACGVTISQLSGSPSGGNFGIGTTTVGFRASDPYGNFTDQSFTVTVVDNQPPAMSCPSNVTEIAPFGNCAANVTFNTPTASDNCAGVAVAQTQGPASGSSFPLGATTVAFQATDASGNITNCSFTVTVVDIEDPVITCPSNISTVSTTSGCGAPITYSAPVATDNCPGVTTALTAGFPSGATFPSGTTTVTYMAFDGSGNDASCSFTVTVAPVPNGTLSLSPSPICQGDQTTLTFTFTSGTPPFNVTVTDGINSYNVNGVSSGSTYNVTPPTTVTYSYTAIQDATGCTRTTGFLGTAQVVVTPLPQVSFTGLDPVYCETESAVTLFGSQNGGTYSGPGITNLGAGTALFDPAVAGPTGPYTINYTFTDINNCTDDQDQIVSVDEQPVANAGAGGSECDLDFIFSAVSTVGIGTWTQVSGPGTAFFSNVNGATSTVQVTAVGTYVFQWTEVNGECSDSDQITVIFYQVPSPNPGFGGSECDLDFQLGATPSIGTGTWSASGPGNATYSPNANDPNAVVTVDAYGTYTLTWTENNGGCTNAASITVVFDQQTTANAGNGGNECDLNFTFNAAPSVGTGLWTSSGPGLATFTNSSSPTATVTVSNYGSYTFTWTETYGNCVSVDIVTVNFYQQPVANAGNGGDECDLNFSFNATASVGTGTWTQLNGPGTSSFANANSATTSVTVSQYGTYTYTWTEVNGTCSDSETVTVNFYEQPVADAGTGGSECDLDFTFNGTASVGVGLWTATGPGTATFANDLDVNTTVNVSVYGTYTFTWTEINGTCSDAASVTVNFYQQPVADAGSGGDECDLTFLASATPTFGTGVWSQASGPGTASFNNASSPTTIITAPVYGTYTFTWTETSGTCTDSETITVNFYQQPIADAGTGGTECDLDFTFSAVPSYGSGLWTSSGPGSASFADASNATTTVAVSQSGIYTFTWTETNGTCVDAESVTVTFYDQPVADAGLGGTECDLNFTFNGTSSFGTGVWAYTGPGSAFFTNANSPTGSVTVNAYGSYSFTWTETNGVCSDSESITVNFYQQPVADAGTGGSECDLDFDLDATPTVGSGFWSYSGPGTASYSTSASDPDATVTVTAYGTYVFTWTEDNNGCISTDDIVIVFNPLPVVSFSGLNGPYCIDNTTPIALTGSPAGGTFSGLGISNNSFIPSIAGLGTIFVTYTYTDVNGCTDSETQTVDVNGLPTVSFSGLSAQYCEDDASAYALVGSPSGGTFNGLGISGNNFIPVNAGDGTHTITYTYSDVFGCTNFSQQSVVVNQLPVVSFSGLAASYCANASTAQLTGSPAGGTFSGTGVTGSSFSPAAAGVGTYPITYTYTDANGCTNSQTQQVTVNVVPVPAITPSGTSAICAGSSVTLDAGSGYSVYSWSNGTNGQTNQVTQAGLYNVTVTTAAGCAGTSPSVTIVVNQPPVVDLGNDTTICTAASLTINAGNAGSTYSWSTQEITQSITVTTTGAYTVQVTDQNGCVGTDNIAVTVSSLLDPVIVASGPLSFCAGGSVTLDPGPGYDTYLWSTGSNAQAVTVSTAGVVELMVWDQFGCSGSDEAIVSVLQLPNAVITPAGPIAVCNGDTVTLSASSSFASYTWSPGLQNTSSIDVWQAGTYTVTVIDPNNGCQATSQPVTVTVNTSVAPTIVPSGTTQFCDGGSVSLSVTPGPYSSYLWTSGSTTPSIVVTETGDYGVTVLDANGCLDSTLLGNPLHVEVWDPSPLAVQAGDSVVVTNGPFDQYQWYFNGAPIPGATEAVYYPTSSGNYSVEAWDENGCSGESGNIEFTFTGVVSGGVEYQLNIYPNPTSGSFTVEGILGSNMDATLLFRDITGREIMVPEVINDVSTFKRTFDVEHLSLGVYYISIQTDYGTVVEPLIKQ